jgi:PAS domain S-box-containing protein
MPNSVKPTTNPPSSAEKIGWILFVFISQFVVIFLLFNIGSKGSSTSIGLIFALFGAILLSVISLGISQARLSLPSKTILRKTSDKSPVHSILSAPQNQSDNILESVSDGIVVTDETGKITMLNNSAAQIAGWNPQDALNLDYHSVFAFSDTKGTPYTDQQNPFKKVFDTGKPIKDDAAFVTTHSSKKKIAVSMSVSPMLDEMGGVVGTVSIVRDVSEEREASRQRAEFISTASHEMRTPVAAIEGYLSLALNPNVSKVDDKARSYLTKAHDATRHLGDLFQDLLTSSKADDGRLTNNPEIIEVGSFIAKLTEDLRFVAQKKSLTVEYVLGTTGASIDSPGKLEGSTKVIQPLYNIYADPERLREVITNLYDNAVKYTNSGKISIGLTGDNNVVQIYVKDTGVGMAPEDVPHLFQKFYRLDNSSTRTSGGTGLGLYISRKIIELYNGQIWAESELGKGSTFFINLPRLSNQRYAELSTKMTPTTVESKEK